MDARYDVVVVGAGAAGISTAIEAADAGARVLVLERGYGGGASALSGGVVYAGGGTRMQLAAGLDDTPENMFAYLRQETGGFVSDETLRRFCEGSVGMIDWLEEQGARFEGSLCPYKTSYPTDRHYLYYSGNEKAWPYIEHARPAARGHRQVAKGMGSGKALMQALLASARRKGVAIVPLARVSDLIVEDGRVRGVRYRVADPEAPEIRRVSRLTTAAGKLGNWMPLLGGRISAKLDAAWEKTARPAEVRADAVVLAAGGFVFDPEMFAEHAGPYHDITPLGTVGDDGTGIRLGVSAGGTTDHLDRISAWRFLTPPSAFLAGVAVGPRGTRITNEDLYGATFSRVMAEQHDSTGYLVMDSRTWRAARGQIRTQMQIFHQAQAAYLFTTGHTKAATLEQLAQRIGVPADALTATITAYNEGIARGEDPAHKALEVCSPVEQGPFYAIDISFENAPGFPAAGLTLGGLRVDEESGGVLDAADRAIPGLYAAGRTAVGICSNSYVSGLSLADCIFSGRRAGTHAATSARA